MLEGMWQDVGSYNKYEESNFSKKIKEKKYLLSREETGEVYKFINE